MIEIRPLSPSDDRRRFSSGNAALDRFLGEFAGQNQFEHHVGVTHVAVEGGVIVGYATVAAAHVEIEGIPARLTKRLPCYPLPVLRLARLAVDASAQGKGVGSALLRYVFGLAQKMAELFGCVGVVIDAKEDAVGFYQSLGFLAMEVLEGASPARPALTPMFLPLKSIPEP